MTDAAYLLALPSPTQSVWYLGPVPIRAYALCIVAGIVAACAVTEIRMRQRGAPPWAVLDIAVWAVPFGIVGGRLYHVITSAQEYFGEGKRPVEALFLWKGGLGIWGAIALGALGAWIGARRIGLPLSFVADAAAPGIPLAQALGRWGNWFNNELYGRVTSLPWGLEIHDGFADPQLRYHPTFLYESLWCLGVAVLVWQLDKRFLFGRGRAFAVYVMGYTAGRFWIEALRIDPAHEILGLRLNDWVALVVFAAALAYFLMVKGPREVLVAPEVSTDGGAATEDSVAEPGEAAAETEAAGGESDDAAVEPEAVEPEAVGAEASAPDEPAGAEPEPVDESATSKP